MSGIIGKLSFDNDETLARPVLEQMLDAASHGNTGRDIHSVPGLALGGTPVGTAGTTWVVADSRLDNARELIAELRRAGRPVGEVDDASLIAQAFELWGVACFSRLEGPFACAIWDSRTRRLVLARDPLGIKPLYFAFLHGHGVVFASDAKALFHDPGVTRDYSPAAIDAYLTLGYVPAPLTAFKRISKVEPAQFIVVDGRRLHAEQYWDVPEPAGEITADAAIEQIEAGLRIASRAELHGGSRNLLLSGGVASLALLTTPPASRGATITVALDQGVDDLTRTHNAATHLGQPVEIEVATLDARTLASELAARFDEPIADPSAISTYAAFIAARQHGPAAVSGHGAATLFGGAPRHTVWDGLHRRSLYTRAFAWEVRDANPRSRYQELCNARPNADVAERSMYVQLRSVLPESTLLLTERVSEAAGLSLRLPFLDRRFVELVSRMPASLRITGDGSMPLLKAMLSRRLPSDLLPAGPTSRHAPEWLRAALPAMVPPVLLAPRFDGRGIVSRPALRALWDEHRSGRRDHALRFWSLLMLEFWFREYIDGDAAEEPLEYAVLKAA